MPLDAYARQTLKAMSNKESLPLAVGVDAYSEPDEAAEKEKDAEPAETDVAGDKQHGLPDDVLERFGDKLEKIDGLEVIRNRVSGKKNIGVAVVDGSRHRRKANARSADVPHRC